MTSLEVKLAKAEMVMDQRKVDPESHVRWCVKEAIRKRHYESMSPHEGLNVEGKEEFWRVMHYLMANGHA